MAPSPPPAVYIAGVCSCSLLALHLLWLATLHRRSRPSVVSGQWQLAATLAGLSGFLVVGAVVSGLIGQALDVSRPASSLDVTWERLTAGGPWWRLAAGGGFVAVVGVAAAIGFWTRRDSLEVHHIDPAALPEVVSDAAASVGLGLSRAVTFTHWPATGVATVTVRRLDPAATDELLAALTARLLATPPAPHSVGGWYTASAAGLLGCTLGLFVAFFRQARVI